MVKAEIHKSSQTLISFNTNELHGLYTDIYTTIIIHITLLRFLSEESLLPNVYLVHAVYMISFSTVTVLFCN